MPSDAEAIAAPSQRTPARTGRIEGHGDDPGDDPPDLGLAAIRGVEAAQQRVLRAPMPQGSPNRWRTAFADDHENRRRHCHDHHLVGETVTTFLPSPRRIGRGSALSAAIAAGPRCDILANMTSLGMRRDDPSPFAPMVVWQGEAVIDIVIANSSSRLRRDAKRFGKTFIEGTAMVRGQVGLFRRFLMSAAASEAAVARAAARPSRCGEPG